MAANIVANAALPSNFQASWFSKDVSGARGLFVDDNNGNILAIARDASPRAVVALKDTNYDGMAYSVTVIAEEDSLTHGLAVFGEYLYASSDTTVFRWPYNNSTNSLISDTLKEVVVQNINADGNGGAPMGHKTRTLVFDSPGRLYVSVGSVGNVDADSIRSRIKRFDLNAGIPSGGFDFKLEGDLFADGLRNEVGLAFDSLGVLWGVENGADNLRRSDLGGDIHNDNPAEELNRFSEEGLHYGYPYCFTEYLLDEEVSPTGRGTVWAWPSFMNDGVHDDNWCRENTEPPRLAMQAHSAPLGITFYDANKVLDPLCVNNDIQPFPVSMDGDAFIAFHGSWNRDVPTGYKIVRVPMNSNGLPSLDEPLDFFCHAGFSAKWPSGIRPVDLRFDKCNRLLITSDGTSGTGGDGLIIISYNGTGNSTSTEIASACGNDAGQIEVLWNQVFSFAACIYALFCNLF